MLAGVGSASIASNDSSSRRLFAATPLLFAAQQSAEGFVWKTVTDNPQGLAHQLAVNSFLVVALIVWPVWLPLSLERFEENVVRRRLLRALTIFGSAVAIGAAAMLIRLRPETTIVGRSLHYDFAWTDDNVLSALMLIAYLIPTILSLFVSTAAYARRIGIMLVLSVLAASYVQKEALTSVWCFFASLLSGTILFAVRQAREPSFQRTPLHGSR